MKIEEHKNTEQVIRYYLAYLPPHCESILNIGCGVNDPYGGILKNRCKNYCSLDIRSGPKVEVVIDITTKDFIDTFENKSFQWCWCSEVLEHLQDVEDKVVAVQYILKVCDNAIFTYPGPKHPSFSDDPGHSEVNIDWKVYEKDYNVHHIITKTDRHVVIITKKNIDYFALKKEQKNIVKEKIKKVPKTIGYFK